MNRIDCSKAGSCVSDRPFIAAAIRLAPPRRKLLKLWIFVLAPLLLPVAMMAEDRQSAAVLLIGVDPSYPPFSSISAAGQLQGFDIDIATALCAIIDRQCSFVQQDWAGLIPELLAGKFDAIVSSMSITEKRRQQVAFTDRYYTTSVRYVSKKGSGFNPGSMHGQAIGAMQATVASDWLKQHLNDPSALRLFSDPAALIEALDTGLVAAVFGDAIGFVKWLEEHAGKYEFVGEAYFIDEGIGIALRKQDQDLRLQLNQAIQAILDNGTYASINARYFAFDLYHGE